MKTSSLNFIGIAIGAILASLAVAQTTQIKLRVVDPCSALNNPAVQNDMKLTKEQTATIKMLSDAFWSEVQNAASSGMTDLNDLQSKIDEKTRKTAI